MVPYFNVCTASGHILLTGKDNVMKNNGFFRSSSILGWFAVEKRKYEIAIDSLQKYAKKSDLNWNILCYAKTKSGDVESAINELLKQVEISKQKPRKMEITAEFMDTINKEVKSLDSPQINDKYSTLCAVVDNHAVLNEKSIKEQVLMTIERNPLPENLAEIRGKRGKARFSSLH